MKYRGNGTTVPQKVLVSSDQNGFSRDLIARWQMQPHVPEFTALSSDLLRSTAAVPLDVVIAGDVRPERTAAVLSHLNQGSIPAVYVASVGEPVHTLRRDYARVIVISRHDAWLDTVVLLTEEILRR